MANNLSSVYDRFAFNNKRFQINSGFDLQNSKRKFEIQMVCYF